MGDEIGSRVDYMIRHSTKVEQPRKEETATVDPPKHSLKKRLGERVLSKRVGKLLTELKEQGVKIIRKITLEVAKTEADFCLVFFQSG